jgi:hypothetical protein
VSGCLGTSRSSSRGSSRRSSSTTPPCVGSSSTTSPPPCARGPQHVARLVTRLVAPLVVNYSASRRLVVDYFASAAHPGASACRAARRMARRRLLRLCCASRCLGMSRGLSRGSSSTTSLTPRVRVPWPVARIVARLVVDCFAYAARLGASARLATHRVACCRLFRLAQARTPHVLVPRHIARHVAWFIIDYSTSHRLVVDYFAYAAQPGASARRAARCTARRRLLRLRRASGCLGTSRGPVTRLIVDYSVRRDFVLRPRWLYFSHAVHRDYLSRGNTGSTSSTPRAATTSSSGRIASTIHLD